MFNVADAPFIVDPNIPIPNLSDKAKHSASVSRRGFNPCSNFCFDTLTQVAQVFNSENY
jgi:hypothetical protein